MAKMYCWAAFALVGLSATGCVTQRQYRTATLERDQARQEAMEAKANAEYFRMDAEQNRLQLQAMTSLNGQLQDMSARLDEINSRYSQAVDVGGTPLPQALSAELTAFADEHADVLSFDAERGIVKFKSDVTFGKGSADLSPKGRETLAKLAAILNKQSVQGHEIMVAGHTDNTRVGNPNTIKAGHKDNWYLSSHRAIVVGKELRKHKVGSDRMAMVGYADQRPIAANSSETGRSQNRRVEVLILPTLTRTTAGQTPQTTTLAKDAAPSTQPVAAFPYDLLWSPEDEAQAEVDHRPFLNK